MDTVDKWLLAILIVIILLTIGGCSYQMGIQSICQNFGYTAVSGFNSCICRIYKPGGIILDQTIPLDLVKAGTISELGCGK